MNEFCLPRAAALSLALLSTSAIVTPAAAQQAPAGPSAQALPGAKQQPLPAVVVNSSKPRRQAAAPRRKPATASAASASRSAVRRDAAVPASTSVGAEAARLPASFAGGQVARGAQVGLLGNKDYMATPYSISSYTEKTIRDLQATSVAEVLTTTDPSVRAAIGAGNRYDALTIRGFRVENSETSLNGLYGLVPNYRTNPAPIERIELLKGPGAFLNGMAPQGSIGGSVNIVTKRAADDPLTRMTAGYMSDARFGTAIDIGRRYGDNKELGVRFNGAIEGGDTPIDRQSARNGSASLGVDYRGERLRVSADIIYQNDWMRAAARGYTPVPGIAMPAAPDPKINLAQPFDYSNAQSVTALTRAEYDLTSNLTLFGAIGVNRFNFDKQEAPGATILNTAGDAQSTSKFQTGKSETVSGEAGVRSRFDTGPVRHEVVVSGSSMQLTDWLGQTTYGNYATNIYRPTLLASPGVPVSFYPTGRADMTRLQSVGVADTLSMIDGMVQLTVGARQQQVVTSSYSSATGDATDHYDQSKTSPSVALVLRPIKQLSFYGSYIEGLTPASPPPSLAANPTQVFAPYQTRQVEVGAKLDLGTFGATLAAFQIAVPSGLLDPVTKIYSVDGEQRHRGIELNAFGEVAPGVRVLGGVTFLDARLTRTPGHVNDGNRAVGAPELQGNLGVEWDTPFLPGLTATARAIYTSSSYVSADNLQQVPSWTTFDIGARYATTFAGRPTTLRASITNLMDKRYWIANPTGYVISGMARTVWLSMSVDF
ncbi:TonB-dependent siderophore receptor [Bradyrhizobium sp. U87765 SZCCT0131]|uniref:TonB-dependent receptor n=1 Tax=unclassified Bradyrhizobium TaxID=2631580 RepID=UPI001BA648AA|nr:MULTISPECIES: TonB-dependent siderophore receptor [unclassified Bradyrhizobium]MBR1222919.1 TonB-dependent siderophore receptor [Bradyrhizobium sp. U87765 SZCCT0131]MBR1262655.1 TonB-dependent siderophore receptor [Bradyrhizobium sp. U87765 SZCCT0134]MBR1308873.1 TonB-dependent siderophore receptor [Bradyrhizobium sp. U87765 SZCCT0110]MBR1318437.1 TonB-dependent siderophore receptor [Bradyrhizobium sp. U87765 SZCCT0109]MBR1352141.1 TonB-dependent siderophore receptor [Bradyrhizobium sp. U87